MIANARAPYLIDENTDATMIQLMHVTSNIFDKNHSTVLRYFQQ